MNGGGAMDSGVIDGRRTMVMVLFIYGKYSYHISG